MTAKRWVGLVAVAILGMAVGAAGTAAILIGPLHFQATHRISKEAVFTWATPTPPGAATTPQNTFFAGALQYAIGAAEEKTGLKYAPSGCASGQKCLSHAQETDGENALYVVIDAAGYSGGSKCYVYVYRDPAQSWQTFQLLCGNGTGFSPVYGTTVPVRVSGACANVRQGPGLNNPIVGCLNNGTMVKITATPTFADNKMWWGVASDQVAGMMSQEFLVG